MEGSVSILLQVLIIIILTIAVILYVTGLTERLLGQQAKAGKEGGLAKQLGETLTGPAQG